MQESHSSNSHSRSASDRLTSPQMHLDQGNIRRSESLRLAPAAAPPSYEHALRHQDDTANQSSQRMTGRASALGPVLQPEQSDTTAENPLRALARYDIVFLVDDSGSMKPLWRQARDALTGIVAKSITYDKDGIDIHFLNSERTLEGCTTTHAVERLFDDVRPRSSTPTAIRMDDILRPYVDKVEDAKVARLSMPKPMVVICITDGRADDPETLKDIIIEMAGRLDSARVPPFQLGIQFLQIGSDPDASTFLRELDDDLKSEHSVRDMVDTCAYKGTLDGEFILQCCLGSINRRIDAQTPHTLEVTELAKLIATAFEHDPVVRFWFGAEFEEAPSIWIENYVEDVKSALEIGSVFTVKANEQFVAVAICFGLGHEMADVPDSKERKEIMDMLPPEQLAFRAEFTTREDHLAAQVYPPNFKRENLYCFHLAVQEEFRHRGIASSVVQHLISEAKKVGKQLVLESGRIENLYIELLPVALEVTELAEFFASGFKNGPFIRFWFGVEYGEVPDLWKKEFAADIRAALQTGSTFILRAFDGSLKAAAVCFGLGHEITDAPNSEERKAILDLLPAEQVQFREEVMRLRHRVDAEVYPPNYKRENLYLHHLVINESYRNQGIGSSMIKHLISEAKKVGKQLILETGKIENVQFYQHVGLTLYGSFNLEHYRFGSLPTSYTLATKS
ncbi:MAG: hypothetical protein CYPHOPRED_003510 [Cyphobasidiales sp. Tagirdzhanova-0007]|nr:MAG: hypothetical protein CYPHOPRED_003510 [Cyphobasidiales sp. Tagirdzhanova-0007]